MPRTGKVVHYKLTDANVSEVVAGRAQSDHHGNAVRPGDVVPLLVIWSHEVEGETRVNGRAFLDGTDELWITSAPQGDKPGEWQFDTGR